MDDVSLSWPSGLGRHDFSADHLVGGWRLANACVTFRQGGRAHFLTRRPGHAAVVHGFSEYRFSHVRLAMVRPATAEQERVLLSQCDTRRLGLALPMTANNLYHALFHAPPAFEAFHRLAAEASPAPLLLPLLASHWGLGGQMADGTAPPPRSWHAWEFMVRALTPHSAEAIFSELEALLRARCICFETLAGSTHAFAPSAAGARARLDAFVQAALWHARLALRAASPVAADVASRSAAASAAALDAGVVWVQRRGTSRALTNEVAVGRALRGLAHAVSLEQLPLARQLELLAAVRGLVAVHGQALALIPFLGASARAGVGRLRGAVVEILPQLRGLATRFGWPRRQLNAKPPYSHIYRELSEEVGVHHVQLLAAIDSSCPEARKTRHRLPAHEAALRCNLTGDARAIAREVRQLRRRWGLQSQETKAAT